MSNVTAIWFNRAEQDDERRARLYAGEIFVYDRVPAVEQFAKFARGLIEEALAPHDPVHVHEILSPEELAPRLGKLKPAFTHHPESKRLVAKIMEELGVDLNDCYADVPKMRTAYPTGHLTKGIAYAFPWHRDTWYGAPMAQINWWLPIYPLAANNCMAFDPRNFSNPVENDSERFNYYVRNVERQDVTKFVKEDPRIQPAALALDSDEPEFRLLPEVGGIIVFAGAQLHTTITSSDCLSRYSIDFRTVSRSDVENDRAVVNVDTRCIGTALRDFHCLANGETMPEELAWKLDPVGPAADEVAVFKPSA